MCVSPKWLLNLFAQILGSIACFATPKWRMEMAKANIMECLGVDEQRATVIAEDSMRRFGRMAIEVLRFPLLNSNNIEKLVKVEGDEYFQEAYKDGKGVIMATGHYGNWELLGASAGLKGYPILSIARKQNNGYMDRFINEYRQMVGQKIAYNHGGKDLLS
ncbi:MAG: lysophospholipid acyltransferase family protein, partial [Phascolarctobacterium sp.]|nr:lysophospholipid acyltransferase family protein [Phascolarctobacterium sp.]